jgi:hypothetical protein
LDRADPPDKTRRKFVQWTRFNAKNDHAMKSTQPPRKEPELLILQRRMGMGLSLLGAFVLAAGLSACWWKGGDGLSASCILLLTSLMEWASGYCLRS